ncbi:MAG: glycosyltransferase family 4 protein [Muribaculaceae bacterium]|nr:glycosyltransferase family 4 protein [Muribaculaceae bacterium]
MTIGFDGIRTVDGDSPLCYYDRLLISSLGMEYPRDTFMVYSPYSTDDRGMSWLLSIANVHNKTPYKAFNKWLWRNRGGIFTDFHRHGVKVFHGLDAVLPTGKNKEHVRMVNTVRDLTFKRLMDDYSWFDKINRKSRIKKACRRADRVIATSQFIKDQLVENFHINAEKIDVVYTAFRDEYLDIHNNAVFLNNVKAKYHMPSRFVLAVTHFSSLANLETLYRAFAKIQDKSIDLMLIGAKNDYYRHLKKLAAQLNIDERIVRVSSINKHNFMGAYSLAKAYVDASIDDGIGQTVIESLLTGTPTIASNSGCHREVGGDAAFYFEPKDVDQLAKHLDMVLSCDEEKLQSIKDASVKQASQFTQQALAQNVMLTYNKARGKA